MACKKYKYNPSSLLSKASFLLIILCLISCNRIEKVVDEVKSLQKFEITYDDYDEEFDQYKRSVYVDKNRDFMTGHYYVIYNDKLSEEFVVKGGLLNGIHRTYHPSGYLSNELSYKNGYLDGTKKSFDSEGRVVSSTRYSRGKRIGNEIGYSHSGKELIKTETIKGITYHHSYQNEKLRSTKYLDKIDGVQYEIMLFFDNVESLKAAFAIKEEEDHNQDSKFYILNNQLKIVDSISPKKEPEKMMEIFHFLQQ